VSRSLCAIKKDDDLEPMIDPETKKVLSISLSVSVQVTEIIGVDSSLKP
jgi:hypothetical protein